MKTERERERERETMFLPLLYLGDIVYSRIAD